MNGPTGPPAARRVPLGRAGLPVSTLGFGAATLGGLYAPMTDEQSDAVLQAAWDAGVRYFDTAPHYGVGLSEERLGRFLAGKPRSEYVISTKAGRLLAAHDGPAADIQGAAGFHGTPNRVRVSDYSRDGVLRSVEDSLRRLGLDHVDVVFIHDPDEHVDQALHEAYPALAGLRDEGVLSSVGVGMNQVEVPLRFVRETDADVLLVAGRYTLLRADAGEELLPLCLQRGVDVVAAGAFNSGLLADPGESAWYDYAAAPEALVRRARRIARVCTRHGLSLATVALAFASSHPAVRTVLAGMRTPGEVRQNTGVMTAEIPAALWEDLRAEELLPPGGRLGRVDP